MKIEFRFPCLLLLMLMMCSGCQSTSKFPSLTTMFSGGGEEATEYEQPIRMAVIWKESSVSPPGKKATRGFGGRVYFYNEENEAVKVDGELVVYAFDDSEAEEGASRVPERKYVFSAEDLHKRHGATGIGESYNIWLPWDKVGGNRKTIALLPIFKPTDGLILNADQSIAVLPGKNPANGMAEMDKADSMVRQASVTIEPNQTNDTKLVDYVEQEKTQRTGIRSTTINVSRSLANRMQQAQRIDRENRVRQAQNAPAPANTTVNTPTTTTPLRPTGSPESRSARTIPFGKPGAIR